MVLPPLARAQASRVERHIERRARDLSRRPYAPDAAPLAPDLRELDYDGYRRIRFRPEKALWRGMGLPFQLQMFHRGGLHDAAVELHEVVEGEVRPIGYDPALFDMGQLPPMAADAGFAGFRIHAPINEPDRFEEFAVFLGASYFRAVPRGGVYGLSARAIELGSGEPGEEFPAFRAFYIERPAPGASAIVVHAILDGPSVAGAYRFRITPGEVTLFEVSATLFPRARLANVGLAPLTSMYFFGPDRLQRVDDFRPEVHDSDALIIDAGQAQRTWRPLANPAEVTTSAFPSATQRAFGLLQRRRTLETYQDLEALYHRRPGAWVEPFGEWGSGAVRLVELPARGEGEDNIVASWRPGSPLPAGRPFRLRYTLRWAASAPATPLAEGRLWATGRGDAPGRRRFIVEFDALADLESVRPEVAASHGDILTVALQPNAATGALRLGFQFDPGPSTASEISARLVRGGQAVSETWLLPWRA